MCETKKTQPANIFGCRVIQVIESTLELRGSGTSVNPYRRIHQYYTLDGELLAEVDPKEDRVIGS